MTLSKQCVDLSSAFAYDDANIISESHLEQRLQVNTHWRTWI